MTNEQLATFIHAGGNDELIPLLWDKVCALVYMKAGQYYRAHTEVFAAHGVEECDIKQAGYIAFISALKAFKPESGLKFVTFISFPFRNEIKTLLGMRNKKTDALNNAISLDMPVNDDERDGATLGDLQPDEQSTDFVKRLESAAISEYIRTEVNALQDTKRNVITWYYFKGKTFEDIAQILHTSTERVRQIKKKAELDLRKNPDLKLIYNEYYRSHTFTFYDKYFAWQPENYAAIRHEKVVELTTCKKKSCVEILQEYRELRKLLIAQNEPE